MCAEMMDVTRDEAKRILRRLELEAYSSIISAFRAQGELSRAKKKILQDLGTQLSISTERHRAEVRRAYSDDRLAIVAESIYGAGSCAEWAAEGRRLVPLMPRLVPQTVFSASATAAANSAAAANAKVPVSSGSKAGSSPSSSNASTSSSSSANQKNNSKATTVKQQPQTGGTQGNDTDGYDDDGKPKRKRRLSVSSLNKPVTKVTIPTPTLVSKPLTKQTTSVSTMTKSGKSLGPAGTIKAVPRATPLSASASQVKLLTKTVAVSQAVCQAKTILSYKTMTSVTSSPAKVQTVMTQSASKAQTKATSGTPPKAVLASKTPLSTTAKSISTGSSTLGATASPVPSNLALKPGLNAAQLAARQKVKPAAARFKPLPGTVKFKSVTPATMGTCSTVTMVTPSPSSQASSALPVSSTQPVVRVIHVPGTGGVGVSKPVVVMTTGLSKTTVAGMVPVINSPASLTKSTSQVASNSSVSKAPVSTTAALTSQTVTKAKVSNTATQPVSSASKTVVMTTLVGGTKRVVLSVPAPLQTGPNISSPTTCSSPQGIVITKTQGVPLTSPTVSQSQLASRKDTKPSSALATVCPKPSPTQMTPSLPAPTVTTQVRLRPLPAILPAPPKPSSVAPTAVSNTASIRKLPTILPAPAKSVATVLPTVLVPMATAVVSHAAGQLQPSVPLQSSVSLAVNTAVSSLAPLTTDVVGQQFSAVVSESQGESQGASLHSTNQDNIVAESHGADLSDTYSPAENSELPAASSSRQPVLSEQSCVTECDNNTSSEDDSLLMCSETIDSAGCNVIETPSAMDFFKSMAESTPVKDPVEHSTDETPETLPDTLEATLDPVSLKDVEVSVSDLDSLEVHKNATNEADASEKHLASAKESIDNVTVERLDVSSEISDLVNDNSSEHIYSESLHMDEKDRNCKVNLDSDLQSSLQGVPEDDPNVVMASSDDGLPVENALQIIESFVESMEGSTAGTSEEAKLSANDNEPFELPSGLLGSIHSSSQERSELPEVLTSEMKGKVMTDPVPAVTDSDKTVIEGQQSSGILSRFEDDSWDISDTPIDVLSTSTSSSNSATECPELTEKEIRALEAFGNVRTSGRKRKPPSSLDVSPPRQVSGWVRGALSLLQKVASYRGQGRRKGDFGAATWFLKPVDPVDAPGYYKVIKTPMDFGTIRVKLETGKYQEYTEFHSDMLLVKSNCLRYNPPGHDIRQDCEEVFRYYETEYAKMLERWEKCHVSPAKKPRVAQKTESSAQQ